MYDMIMLHKNKGITNLNIVNGTTNLQYCYPQINREVNQLLGQSTKLNIILQKTKQNN